MPYAIPQAQLYGARGSYADGLPIRNRGQEQANTQSGNPGLPIFNTRPSPQPGTTQTYAGQPQQLGYSVNTAPNGGVANATAAQQDATPGGTNTFGTNVMPRFSRWNSGPAVRGRNGMPAVSTQPSPVGGPPQQCGVDNRSAWQRAHDTQMANDPQYQAAVARAQQQRAAWYASHGQVTNSVQPAPVTLPMMTNS